jgi:sulfoxide reductase heme-binding subunit YedZ
MNAYVIAVVAVLVVILLAVLSAQAIQFEGGANPQSKKKRKMWFWILSVLAPVLTYVLGAFVIHPDKDTDPIPYAEHMSALPIAAVVAIVAYIVLGVVLSKMKVTIKVAHWFN